MRSLQIKAKARNTRQKTNFTSRNWTQADIVVPMDGGSQKSTISKHEISIKMGIGTETQGVILREDNSQTKIVFQN